MGQPRAYAKNPDMSTWTNLKAQIFNANLTGTVVSAKADIPWVRFSQACSGRRQLLAEEYERIAAVLRVHPSELIGMYDPDYSPVTVESPVDRANRQRRERQAMERLRKNHPRLYNRLVYGNIPVQKTPPTDPSINGGDHGSATTTSNGGGG